MIQQQQKSNTQTISSIDQIQTQIENLYQGLEVLTTMPNPDINKQNKLLNEISQLQKLKGSLYKNISNSYGATQASVAEGRNSLVDEVAVNNIVKKELRGTKANLKQLKSARDDKLRMAEINDYYSSKYRTQTDVMKTIVYFCIPILILGILMKKEIVPKNIGMGLMGTLVVICLVVVILQVIDIMSRSNMVFDEYKFAFNPDEVDVSTTSDDADRSYLLEYKYSSILSIISCVAFVESTSSSAQKYFFPGYILI